MKVKIIAEWEHSAVILTFYNLPIVIKIFILSILEWPLKTGLTVFHFYGAHNDRQLLRFWYLSERLDRPGLRIAFGNAKFHIESSLLASTEYGVRCVL